MQAKLWARVIPWCKETAVAALEGGADLLWVPDGCAGEARSLGRVAVACAEGDLREGRDFQVVAIRGKEDETRILSSPPERLWVVQPQRGEVIPLENLVAAARRILVTAGTPEEAALYRGVLEKGVYGLVLSAETPERMRALAKAARKEEERLVLATARITRIVPLGLGDRACVDTCSLIEGSRGMLVGNSSAGLFLVCAENAPNPYVLPRPFRVNAGAVHSYCRLPGGRTSYLSELAAGAAVLLVNEKGEGESAPVGRVKTERRPLLLLGALSPSGAEHAVVLQNAETVRLVGPGGASVSVARLSPGDPVLLAEEAAGRHFGTAVAETIREK